MTFDGLGLSPELLRAVADQGYTEPTPVQRAAIPLVLAGRDVLAGAQTGTGKTAAFVLPIIHTLHATRRDGGSTRHPVRVLVVVPTRELAIQVEESVRTYGAHRPIRSATVYGGVGFGPQVTKLRAGPEIVVATPGRLLDHVSQGTINLSSVEVLVLDEADRMLDMGFIRDIRRILALLPAKRQNLLFSATFSDDIRALASDLLDDPARIQVTPRNTTAELVDQLVIPVDRERKRDLLRELVALGRVSQALVFTRTKHGANRLAQQLERDGIRTAAIHGNRSQAQRVRALEDFKAGRVAMLVATDIAARGLDIEQLPHVVNYELPMVAEDYVHRIGRTGRAGERGQAISLVCVDEAPLLRQIQALLGRAIPSEVIEGFEPDGRVRPEPIRLRSTPAERAEAKANREAAAAAPASRTARTRTDEGVARPHRPGPAAEERPADGRRARAGTRGGSSAGTGHAPRRDGSGGGHGVGASRGNGVSASGGRGRQAGGPGQAVKPGQALGNRPAPQGGARPGQAARKRGRQAGGHGAGTASAPRGRDDGGRQAGSTSPVSGARDTGARGYAGSGRSRPQDRPHRNVSRHASAGGARPSGSTSGSGPRQLPGERIRALDERP